MPANFITLPRSELYDRVWSKPVTEVAKEFSISDVALAKRCRAINIPLPPRGYWARVQAGQSPRRTPLPPFKERKRSSLPNYVAIGGDEGSRGAEHPELVPRPSRGGVSTNRANATKGVVAGVAAKPGRRTRCDRVRASIGESHCDERQRMDALTGPQQSGERSVAGLAACPREQTDQSPSGYRTEDEPTVTFTPRPTPAPTEPATPMSPVEAALRPRIDTLDLAPSADLTAAHPAVLRTAVQLKHLKSRDLTWPRGTRSGPMIEVRTFPTHSRIAPPIISTDRRLIARVTCKKRARHLAVARLGHRLLLTPLTSYR